MATWRWKLSILWPVTKTTKMLTMRMRTLTRASALKNKKTYTGFQSLWDKKLLKACSSCSTDLISWFSNTSCTFLKISFSWSKHMSDNSLIWWESPTLSYLMDCPRAWLNLDQADGLLIKNNLTMGKVSIRVWKKWIRRASLKPPRRKQISTWTSK